jgi:hypothetical protein
VLAAVVTGAGGQDKPRQKLVFAVTTRDSSVGHAAHSSLPQRLGDWRDEGLDVSVTSVEGSAAGLQQLGSGNIDVVSADQRFGFATPAQWDRLRGIFKEQKPVQHREPA